MDMIATIAGVRACGSNEYDLISALWGERGLDPVPACNAGQFALARWMLGDDSDAGMLISRIPSEHPNDYLVRVLTGEVLPGDLIANYFARITHGAVGHELWGERHILPVEAATPPVTTRKAADLPPQSRPPIPRYMKATSALDLVRCDDDDVLLLAKNMHFRVPASEIAALHSSLGMMMRGGRPVMDRYPFRNHRSCAEWRDADEFAA